MNIYLPYVYLLTHKITGHFYIGMRSANKVIAEDDLGHHYFTSSKIVKSNFKDYNITILAYFINWESAFIFENNTIKENWGNALLLNKHYQKDTSSFSMKGHKRPDLSERNRLTKSKPKESREYKCNYCGSIINIEEFCHHPYREVAYCNKKCSGKVNGKMSGNLNKGKSIKGHPAWNKGIAGSTIFSTNNPMNNPILIQKMLETRAKNKASRLDNKDD